MAKLLFIFLFFSFLGLITQRGVWESVMSQVLHSYSHIIESHNITLHDITW